MLAFLVGPVISARLLTHHLPRLILLAMGLGVLCSVAGVALSRHILSVYQVPLSTAGLVVSLISLTYVLVILSWTFRRSRCYTRELRGDDGKKNCNSG